LIVKFDEKKLKRIAVLDAIRAPLALGDLTEDVETLVMKFVNNIIFYFSLYIFECVPMVQLAAGKASAR
jgi:hypothetical protein